MIIQANTTQMSSVSSGAIGNLAVSNGKANEQPASTTSSQSDSLTISAQGMALFAENQKLSSSVISEIKSDMASSSSSTTNTLLTDSASEDEEDTTTTTDLSSYSDTQLKQLVADGTISEAEAAAEIAKRQGSKSTTQDDSTNLLNLAAHIDTLI